MKLVLHWLVDLILRVYNMVLSNELDPYKCLLKQINSERYDAIENILCA